ncbi:hypothetical protein XAUB_40180 [Xanthomonas citri pv. aurantifolii str. ICPB 11122]|nr:hypothetical protein XAUB_40180 [Xanthomonas citri pv. aurantifolii str. ICPB 11122]
MLFLLREGDEFVVVRQSGIYGRDVFVLAGVVVHVVSGDHQCGRQVAGSSRQRFRSLHLLGEPGVERGFVELGALRLDRAASGGVVLGHEFRDDGRHFGRLDVHASLLWWLRAGDQSAIFLWPNYIILANESGEARREMMFPRSHIQPIARLIIGAVILGPAVPLGQVAVVAGATTQDVQIGGAVHARHGASLEDTGARHGGAGHGLLAGLGLLGLDLAHHGGACGRYARDFVEVHVRLLVAVGFIHDVTHRQAVAGFAALSLGVLIRGLPLDVAGQVPIALLGRGECQVESGADLPTLVGQQGVAHAADVAVGDNAGLRELAGLGVGGDIAGLLQAVHGADLRSDRDDGREGAGHQVVSVEDAHACTSTSSMRREG